MQLKTAIIPARPMALTQILDLSLKNLCQDEREPSSVG